MFLLLPNYRRGFCKTSRKSIFVDSCFFSYLHVFGKRPLNPPKTIREKTHLVRIHLQELIFIYQNNFEYLTEINVLVSIIFKILRECYSINESQIRNIRENIFQENGLGPLHRNWYLCVFWRCHNRFHKTIIWKKLMNLREFFVIYKISYDRMLWLMENTVILRKYYVTMLLCKYYVTMEILWICFNEKFWNYNLRKKKKQPVIRKK